MKDQKQQTKRIPERSTNARGLSVYDIIDCKYGEKIKVYDSSSATAPHVWVMIDTAENKNDHDGGTRIEATAHLTVDQATALRDALDTFLKEIPERWGATDEDDTGQ
jgi:hypothetical protein